MRGELAEISIHLFPNGMYVECEEIDDAKFIPQGDIQPLVDFINEVSAFTDPNATFQITGKGREHVKKLNNNTEIL